MRLSLLFCILFCSVLNAEVLFEKLDLTQAEIENFNQRHQERTYNWHPLNVGNKWVFSGSGHNGEEEFQIPPYVFEEVLSDSLIDGEIYYQTYFYDFSTKFLRTLDNSTVMRDLDDLDNNPETTELLIDSLNIEQGESFESYLGYITPVEMEVLGEEYFYSNMFQDTLRVVTLLDLEVFWEYGFVEGVGFVYITGDFFWCGLRGLVLDGVTYGDITVSNSPDYSDQYNVNLTNYPNPFNPETRIDFTLQKTEKVELNIYNIRGQKIETIVNDILDDGDHSYFWEGKDKAGKEVSSGVYFYKLLTKDKVHTKKMILMK